MCVVLALVHVGHITSSHVTSSHITSPHITSSHITSSHITSSSHGVRTHRCMWDISHHLISHHLISHHHTSHHHTSHHLISHHPISHHLISHHLWQPSTSRHTSPTCTITAPRRRRLLRPAPPLTPAVSAEGIWRRDAEAAGASCRPWARMHRWAQALNPKP